MKHHSGSMNNRLSSPADIGHVLPASARARKRSAATTFLGGLSRTSRRLILIGAALALAIVLATALLGWILRRDAQANAERGISGLSVLLAEQTARTIQSVDLQVRELRDRIALDGPADAQAFRVRFATQEFHQEIERRAVNLPQLNGIIIVDASGQLLNFNRAWPIPALDLSDRDYYQHFLAHPDDDGMYISLPVRNRIDGRWTLYLARRVAAADGRLVGLVLGAIDLRYFSDLYSSIGLAPGSLVTLLRRDGVVVAEYPERPGIMGNSLPASSNWYRLSQNDSAHYRFTTPFGGGEPLFVALKHTRGYDLVVNVAITEPYVFAEWRRLVLLLALGSGPGLIVMVGLLRALVVQLRRIEVAGATAEQRNQELEEIRHTLDLTLENMDEGLIMVGADDRLAVCNRRAQEILQVSDEVSRRRPTLSELLTETRPEGNFDAGAPDPRFLMEYGGGSTVPHHDEQLLPDGSVVEVRTVPLAGGGIVRTFTDITKRRHVEEALRHSQKMEAIGRLSAGVAHDFNNILQSIVGGLEVVLEETETDTAAYELAKIAIRSAMRGSSLTHHLLAYAGKQVLQPKTLEVTAFLAEIEILLARTLGPQIDIRIRADRAAAVAADSGQLETALLNLAINASHAMPRGGKLSMDARVESEASQSWVVISVTDTGTGMDEATLAQATEPFFTTKGLEGSGLGLSMVKGFAEQSGGRLSITSALGQGTTVELHLPAAACHLYPERSEPSERSSASNRILLVDDSPEVLLTTGRMLNREGFTVVSADSGEKALSLLAEGECFDAVVSDYAMPGLNGTDLIAQAQIILPGLKAILITGYADISDADTLPEGTPVLHKPFQRANLIDALKHVMKQGQNAVYGNHPR